MNNQHYLVSKWTTHKGEFRYWYISQLNEEMTALPVAIGMKVWNKLPGQYPTRAAAKHALTKIICADENRAQRAMNQSAQTKIACAKRK